MESTQKPLPTKAEDPLAGAELEVFENANTVTKWLLSQAKDSRPE